jgi:hypothetical protein
VIAKRRRDLARNVLEPKHFAGGVFGRGQHDHANPRAGAICGERTGLAMP